LIVIQPPSCASAFLGTLPCRGTPRYTEPEPNGRWTSESPGGHRGCGPPDHGRAPGTSPTTTGAPPTTGTPRPKNYDAHPARMAEVLDELVRGVGVMELENRLFRWRLLTDWDDLTRPR